MSVPAQGGTLPEDLSSYDLLCPTGQFVTGIDILTDTISVTDGRTDVIAAIGPITCSDGSKVGNKTSSWTQAEVWTPRAPQGEGYSGINLRAGEIVDAISLETTDGERRAFTVIIAVGREQLSTCHSSGAQPTQGSTSAGRQCAT
jgi:hypothetical protein